MPELELLELELLELVELEDLPELEELDEDELDAPGSVPLQAASRLDNNRLIANE